MPVHHPRGAAKQHRTRQSTSVPTGYLAAEDPVSVRHRRLEERMNIFGKKASPRFFFLAISLFSVVAATGWVIAQEDGNERDHNSCRQRHFGTFSDWSEPVNLGPMVNSE